MTTHQLECLSDAMLIAETKRAAETERRSTAELLALLNEVERRRLHLALGHSSLFVYCVRALHLSEQTAYSRITAARAARRYPQLLPLLAEGALTLSSVGILAPHLTDDSLEPLLEAARFKSTRDVERLIASLHPQPDIPASVRALPEPKVTPKPVATEAVRAAKSPEPLRTVERDAPRRVLSPLAPGGHLKLRRTRHVRHAPACVDCCIIQCRTVTWRPSSIAR
jgi:hypothetical protein